MKMNPVEKSQYISKRYKEYLKSSFEFGESNLQELFLEQLEKEDLFKGPYVDLNFPFKRGKNIDELIKEGIVCESFHKLKDIHFTRPLYSHQEESIRKISDGRSVVITTGTGSGKTESFLYPILNELLFEVEKGVNNIGVRAIFLYPMNALVNDQIDRIRKILQDCPEITFGFFTGETPEKSERNHREKLGKENGVTITDNELVSREEIRERPPHLLFTNYSMLEYLLIRPNDYSIFEAKKLDNWKYVVLDEAHSYTGALGIELSMLLRRLTGLAPKRPQFLLTSATLGQQGKSEDAIVEFAKRLTSAEFSVEDIIFSKRIALENKAEYRVAGDDYCMIKKSLESKESLIGIFDRYSNIKQDKIDGMLYELLSKDKNVDLMASILKKGSKQFKEILSKMSDFVNQEQLIALIDIINISEKNEVGLFDLKYHSFVRPLSGAYITYGRDPKLSLTKTNEIDGLKAFEIGNCKYCKATYIIGKIQRNQEDHMDYLYQNKEVDIYENYGNEKFVAIDYFIFENNINEDETEVVKVESYEVCSKCGEIHASENLNANKCKCEDSYRFKVFKVMRDEGNDDSMYNNITYCPCCNHKGKSGVVKALNIGKDEGTALIAQILYEAIDDGESRKKEKSVGKLSFKPIQRTTNDEEEKTKQFLAFSDSRQQASFAAVFFDSNHVRMLRKRLIWEMIKESGFKDITVDELAARLEGVISEKYLFENNMSSQKNAWAAVLVDLLKVDGAYDGEGLGLYYFDLNIEKTIHQYEDTDIQVHFEVDNFCKDELYTLMQVVMSIFKTSSAIRYLKSSLTQEEKRDVLEYRRFSNYVALKLPHKNGRKSKEIRSLLPVTGESNKIVRYIMKVFNCNVDKASIILAKLFEVLHNLGEENEYRNMLYKHEKEHAYQIDASFYIVKNYQTSKYYQCKKCKKITPYNIKDKCPQDKCEGVLKEIDPDETLKLNFYRQQYKDKKIERIIVKEHTAQLARKYAKEYQNDFKNKKINILSCSTTFEMGIDIGGLETVFMRNVPPTPANYVQRAGRAGRRKDSAYILTYCGVGSHDYTYFSSPEKMISGIINPPFFNVLNKKIITRHLMATSLGYFFRNYPKYFNSLNEFVINGGGVEKYKEYMSSCPKDLNDYIKEKILPESEYEKYWDNKWYSDMDENDTKIVNFVETINGMINELKNALEISINERKFADSQSFKTQIANIENEDVISYLSKFSVIPKYGFPVDVVDMEIYEDGKAMNKYAMSRDLRIAISEYAPDSEVIVDGHKYTSKYITIKKETELQKNYFVKCPTCRKLNIFLATTDESGCKYCGESMLGEISEYYIVPKDGFKTGLTKESTRLKPKRSYAGEVTYIGGGRTDEKRLVLGNVLGIETSSDDELLVMNKSVFYVCSQCGYGQIEKTNIVSPEKNVEHKNCRQFTCSNRRLERMRLGHRFVTDVARFTIPMLNKSESNAYPKALSFLYAFLEGISTALDIERNDIDGVLELNLEWESYDILLFDNVPGGAGHVKRLLSKKSVLESLKASVLHVKKDCCDENTSCYNCLRNYYNQAYHSRLNRKFAIEVIEKLRLNMNSGDEKYQTEKWHLNKDVSPKTKIMKLTLGMDGRNSSDESAEEIWLDLLDDCYDENEIDIVTKLMENSPSSIGSPYYHKTMKIDETNEEFVADLIWYERQTILFLNDSFDQYEIAKKTGWHLFSTSVKFKISDLLEKVGD